MDKLDSVCERLIEEMRDDIAAIDSTVGRIAEPMADQLAKGAVADIFDAAADVLKAQIRTGSKEDDLPQ